MAVGKKARVALISAIPAIGIVTAVVAPAIPAEAANCGTPTITHSGTGTAEGNGFSAYATFTKSSYCFRQQNINWFGVHTGFEERLRYRTTTGALKLEKFLTGTTHTFSTTFASASNYSAAQLCVALVEESNTATVVGGPICFNSDTSS